MATSGLRRLPIISALLLAALGGASATAAFAPGPHGFDARPAAPTPEMVDRLATPVMPPNPSQVDVGRGVYYNNCMPCHGDRGQGLTDEFRAIWVEDHQDCWARGCHGGRQQDEGFPLPRAIPAVIGPPPVLARFETPGSLFSYLRTTHPPQRPGALADEQYWAVTALLFSGSGRLASNVVLGPNSGSGGNQPGLEPGQSAAVALSVLALAAVVLIIVRARGRK